MHQQETFSALGTIDLIKTDAWTHTMENQRRICSTIDN